MQDPKKQLKKLIKRASLQQDAPSTLHEEALLHTDELEKANESLKDIKEKLEEPIEVEVPEPEGLSPAIIDFVSGFLSVIKGDKGEKGEGGEKGEKGEQGEPGKTPVKGTDYLTDSEVNELIQHILKRATPIKGTHYFDGTRGPSGMDGEKGDQGPQGKPGVGTEGKSGKDGKSVTVKEVLEALKKLPEVEKPELRDIVRNAQQYSGLGKKGSGYKLTDQRWHGAGSGAASIYVDTFTTVGGSEVITLTNTPITVLEADVNGSVIYETDDYTLVADSLTLLNANLPAGLKGKFVYVY